MFKIFLEHAGYLRKFEYEKLLINPTEEQIEIIKIFDNYVETEYQTYENYEKSVKYYLIYIHCS